MITNIYEPATGMKVNIDKTEGLRLGKLRGRLYDSETRNAIHVNLRWRGRGAKLDIHVSRGWGIKWCRKGEYIVSLGTPIGWDFDLESFWGSKYYKTKSLMARWHDVERMSPQGSAMVGNAMVFSRFRYYAYNLPISSKVSKAIDADVQALVWGKDVQFDPEELGHGKVKRYMLKSAQYSRRNQGGLGLLHWDSHIKALADTCLFQYANGSSMPWKHVLDWWFAKFPEGRGAIFSSIPTQSLIASRNKGTQSSLPKFYKNALRYLREVELVPVQPGKFLHPNEAWAEPLWSSPRIKLSNPNFRDTWQQELRIRTIGDMVDPFTGSPYTIRKVKSKIRQALRVEGEYIIGRGTRDIMGFRQRTYTPVSRLITQWSCFLRNVGLETLHYAAAEEGESPTQVYKDIAR